MRIRFAIWETGPAAYFDHHHLPELEEHGVGVEGGLGLQILVLENGVDLLPGPDEPNIQVSKLSDRGIWPFILRTWTADYVARCCAMFLNFQWTSDHWHTDLPLPHLLPWPAYHEYETGPFDKHEAVVREIQIRIDSAERHTGSRAIRVDRLAQVLLTREERVRLFEEWRI